jgi:hypothetical protein
MKRLLLSGLFSCLLVGQVSCMSEEKGAIFGALIPAAVGAYFYKTQDLKEAVRALAFVGLCEAAIGFSYYHYLIADVCPCCMGPDLLKKHLETAEVFASLGELIALSAGLCLTGSYFYELVK